MVIQVSDDNPRNQTIVMNNAVNLQKYYGMDNEIKEIVAYGPGLTLLVAGGKQSRRVESLAKQDITFSACSSTMARIEKRDGKSVVLNSGVQVAPARGSHHRTAGAGLHLRLSLNLNGRTRVDCAPG